MRVMLVMLLVGCGSSATGRAYGDPGPRPGAPCVGDASAGCLAYCHEVPEIGELVCVRGAYSACLCVDGGP